MSKHPLAGKPAPKESLVNIEMEDMMSSSIVMYVVEDNGGTNPAPVRIDLNAHETSEPDWQKANLASDFITYRVLFRFYHFTNSEEIDLWPVFYREILPFCSGPLSTGIGNLADEWGSLSLENPRHFGYGKIVFDNCGNTVIFARP